MDEETRTPESPTLLLDRYRIDGMLGEGGLGTVVKAFDTRLKRFVAIKTLKRGSYAADPDQFRSLEERFAREAEAGSRMGSHPNLVSVYDLIIDADRTQYLILEYIPGGTLAERIAERRLSLSETLAIATESAQGLHSAHEVGLVHRDIKPSNIFLTATGHAKVGDFGIAQIDDLSGRTRATAGHPGTPLYMSPEQERQTAYLRPASDQYSLGLVLFEMLTGEVYKRIGARQAASVLAAQIAPVPALVARMLADNPDDRYPTMAEVVRAIQAIERQRASAETEVPTRVGNGVTSLRDEEALVTTRYETPRIDLYPLPHVTPHAPPPALLTERRYPRRAVLIGAGGLVLAVGAAGGVIAGRRNSGGGVSTATIPATVVAAVPISPTANPTIVPTATNVPPAIATAHPAMPIVITVPPLVITATPLPTAALTATPIMITATAPAVPSPRIPVVTASEVGLSASVFEQPTQTRIETDSNIVAKLFSFSHSFLRLYLFQGETGGDTPEGWYRVQRYSLNVPASSKLVPAVAADGRKGYTSDVAGVCDEAETQCLPCSFGPQGVVCPSNTGLIRPIHWYHVILAAQAPGGIVVGDYFCNLADKSSRDCYNDALTILPSMRVIGPPASR